MLTEHLANMAALAPTGDSGGPSVRNADTENPIQVMHCFQRALRLSSVGRSRTRHTGWETPWKSACL